MNPFVISRKIWVACPVVLPALLLGCITPRPVVTPAPGVYKCPLMVTITDPRLGAKIFYTIDGSTPTTASASYSGPFPISTADTVQAIAVAQGSRPSHAANVAYSCALTRMDFAKLMQKQYSLAPAGKPANFPDVAPNHPAYSAIQAAAPFMNAQVLCPGCYLKPEFYPGEPIYREISTLALVRVLVASGKIQLLSAKDSAAVLARVPDAANLPSASRPYFATAIRLGILRLREGNTIQPALLQTPQDMATIFTGIQKQFNFPPVGVIGVPQ